MADVETEDRDNEEIEGGPATVERSVITSTRTWAPAAFEPKPAPFGTLVGDLIITGIRENRPRFGTCLDPTPQHSLPYLNRPHKADRMSILSDLQNWLRIMLEITEEMIEWRRSGAEPRWDIGNPYVPRNAILIQHVREAMAALDAIGRFIAAEGIPFDLSPLDEATSLLVWWVAWRWESEGDPSQVKVPELQKLRSLRDRAKRTLEILGDRLAGVGEFRTTLAGRSIEFVIQQPFLDASAFQVESLGRDALASVPALAAPISSQLQPISNRQEEVDDEPKPVAKVLADAPGLVAALIEFMANRDLAAYTEIRHHVYEDKETTDEAIRQLITRANALLTPSGVRLRTVSTKSVKFVRKTVEPR